MRATLEGAARIVIPKECKRLAKVDRRKQDIHTALVEARGAWGTGKSLAEIDREISARREADWPIDGTTKS